MNTRGFIFRLVVGVFLVFVLAVALAGCTSPDLDKAACEDVAAYVRGESSADTMLDRSNLNGLDPDLNTKLAALRDARDANETVWNLRLETVAQRCLDLYAERGW